MLLVWKQIDMRQVAYFHANACVNGIIRQFFELEKLREFSATSGINCNKQNSVTKYKGCRNSLKY